MPKLIWTGKDKVINHHHEVPFRVLEHQYNFTDSESNSNGNKIIHGDNLEALKSLLPEYEGRIKCIYIDPPYNTGNEGWVYNDNVNDEKIKKWLGEVVGKEGEDLSRHDKWLCMMYPRLKLLHKLLADDGVIFVSIDDNEQANLKLIMDEVFGLGNFIANIIWEKSDSPRMDASYFSVRHDSILVYAKNKSSLEIFNEIDEEIPAHYNRKDENGRIYYTKPLRVMGGNISDSLYFPMIAPDRTEVLPIERDGSKGCWRWSKKKVDKESDRIDWVNGKKGWNPYFRIYADNRRAKPIETIWSHDEVGSNRTSKNEIRSLFSSKSAFDTPKPSRLIKRILKISTKPNDIILDSFAGSGTTAHAVLKLNKEDGGNRKFILVETMDYAETITAERVRRVMKGYGKDKKAVEGLGGGFDYYEIGDVIFDGEGNLNEAIELEEIRKYVAFTENISTTNQVSIDNELNSPYLLGKMDETAYFFIYEKDSITTLNLDFIASLNFKPETLIIYADNCLLSKEVMQKYNIIFKKIPRDITRF